jgi:lipopolysaccharide/colanic/teichoic acid biosynthesis glycosyltransferase
VSIRGRVYRWFEYPHRFVATRARLARPGAVVLDVGCGNHSPWLTKDYFPHCVYHGVDRDDSWNLDPRDLAAMDRFFRVDLDRPGALDVVPDGSYDVVLVSHLLEHLSAPEDIALQLARKLRPGGLLFLEVPSRRSLRLPRAADGWFGIRGCLNFYDDPTHRQLVDLGRIGGRLRTAGLEVDGTRPRRLRRRIVLLPAYALAGLILRGYVPATVVWDVTGFAARLVARRPGPDEAPVKREAALKVKRLIDVVGAGAGLLLLSPLLAGAAVAVWTSMGRPIFFRHERPGYKGRPFTIRKFRTMRPAREGEVWFRTDEERLTRVGRFLRRTSIDELPQLWSVLRGEMSLVGPRPLLVEYLSKYTPEQMRRHDMTPGLTGWAQVNGRRAISFSKRLECDVWYVDNFSLGLDARILARTVRDVLRPAGTIPGQSLEDVDDLGLAPRDDAPRPEDGDAPRR